MRYLKTFFLQYHLIFLLRFNVKIFSSAVQKCPENGKNQKEIKWLLMALQKIFRFRWAFLFFEIFRWFFFQKIQHNFLHPNNELALFHLWTVALKIGPKVKQVGPKTKKNNTKAGITQDCNEQRPKFFHQELVQIEGLLKKGC